MALVMQCNIIKNVITKRKTTNMKNINVLSQLLREQKRLESIFKINIIIDCFGYTVKVPYAETYLKGYEPDQITSQYDTIDALIFTINDLDYPVSKLDICLLCDFLCLGNKIKSEMVSKCYNSIVKDEV